MTALPVSYPFFLLILSWGLGAYTRSRLKIWFKTSSSSSYFTSPSFVFTFILFYPSIVRFIFWRLCVSMNKINFRYSISIYIYWVNITRYSISSYFEMLTFLKSKIELQVTYVNSICIHDLGKYEQGLKHSNTFYQQFFDTCCWKWILSVLQFP